jgi:hypothetical protein
MAIAALYDDDDDDDENDDIDDDDDDDDDDDGRHSKQNILNETPKETDQASHPYSNSHHHPDKTPRTSFQSNKNHKGTAVVRGSDDYWPMDEASHGPHLFVNAMNSLLFANVNNYHIQFRFCFILICFK